jgi:hypothetical protein
MIQTATTTCAFDNKVFFYGTFTDFEFGSSTCITISDIATSSTSTNLSVSYGFSHGEIVISFLVFIILIGLIFFKSIPKLRKNVFER